MHVTTRLSDGSVEHRIYNWNPHMREPMWGAPYSVVNGSADEAEAIVKLMNNQFNIEINN